MFKKFGKLKFPTDPISTSFIRSYNKITLSIIKRDTETETLRCFISRPTVFSGKNIFV